ncbi:MAG: DUF1365 domain-containing protein [Pseudomonadota bacterium]
MTEAGVLYPAKVMHRRLIAPLYRFVYSVFYVLVDVDRLGELHKRFRFFSHNGFNLIALRDRDHGHGRGLRAWAETVLAGANITLAGGRIRLLAMPRVLGMGFNPISLWFCEHKDGSLRALIAEVRNTFGETHSYLLASGGDVLAYNQPIEKEKCFHVSPLMDLVGRYRFTIAEPGERLRAAIHETREGVPMLDATLAGERRELSDAAIVGQVLRMPWLMLKVMAGIHWEALKIWLRGAKFYPKPASPKLEVT